MLTRRLLDLSIPKRGTACCACEIPFEPEQPIITLLREGEEEAYVREDHCLECWEKVAGVKDEGAWSIWQGRMPSEKKMKVQEMAKSGKERALGLLRGYVEGGEQARAFLLAMYLERRDVLLRCKELKRKGGRVRMYEVVETGEAILVPRLEQVAEQEKIQEELLQALRGDA